MSAAPGRTLRVELTSAATIDGPNCADRLFPSKGAVITAGVAADARPSVDRMDLGSPILAVASIKIDIGVTLEACRRFGPVVVRHPAKKDKKEEEKIVVCEAPDKRTDQSASRGRYDHAHSGCVPIGGEGRYGARFHPGRGSVCESPGHIRQGCAPFDFATPDSALLTDAKLKIG